MWKNSDTPTTSITFWVGTMLYLPIYILFLPVGWLSGELLVWCSQAPSGSRRLISHVWQQQDISMWQVRLQSAKSGGCLATGLQCCYVTEARQHNNSKHPFIVSSHITDAKIEEKSRTLSLLFLWKCFLSINHHRSCCACEVFLERWRLNRSIWNSRELKLVHPCLFHIRDREHNWVNVFKYLSELIQPLWDGWYCT